MRKIYLWDFDKDNNSVSPDLAGGSPKKFAQDGNGVFDLRGRGSMHGCHPPKQYSSSAPVWSFTIFPSSPKITLLIPWCTNPSINLNNWLLWIPPDLLTKSPNYYFLVLRFQSLTFINISEAHLMIPAYPVLNHTHYASRRTAHLTYCVGIQLARLWCDWHSQFPHLFHYPINS